MDGIEKVHAQAFLRAIRNAGDLRDAEGRCVGREDCARTADFIEQSENLDLRFHLLGNGLDHKISFARGFFDRGCIFDPGESRVRYAHGNLTKFDRFIELRANLALRLAQRIGKKIFKNRAVPAECGHISDATPHGSGANYGDRFHFGHY